METEAPPEKLVGALSSGLAVLRYMSAAEGRVGVTRVARDLGLNASTCFNILRTLVHEGLVSFDPETKAYGLSLGLVELAKGSLTQASYVRMIRPELEALMDAHSITATLWQRTTGERVVLVDHVDGRAEIRVHMSVGQRLPMFIAALGRCMAAHAGLSRAELKKRFSALRWDAAPTFEQYAAEVERARTQGYAVDDSRYVRGITSVSSAILDGEGHPVMAISAMGISAQLKDREIAKLAADVKALAARISKSLAGGATPANHAA
jgi:DNA-binding IclR family transcriptional regulator